MVLGDSQGTSHHGALHTAWRVGRRRPVEPQRWWPMRPGIRASLRSVCASMFSGVKNKHVKTLNTGWVKTSTQNSSVDEWKFQSNKLVGFLSVRVLRCLAKLLLPGLF